MRCVLTLSRAQLGQTAQARQELEELACEDFADLPRDGSRLPSLSALSSVAFMLGDAPRAHLLYDLLLPYADRCVNAGALLCVGSASRFLGLLATTLSRYDDAARHFEQALEMDAQIRSPLWIGYTQLGYAGMLLRRDEPGDNGKARPLLTHARAAADELGLKALADDVQLLERTTEAAEPPAALAELP
jgi:tetratricopeptide (TPR) repeat protein